MSSRARVPFEGIAGHERALHVLASAFASGRVPHAYLFWGPEGVGKELTARAAAAVLLCADAGALSAAAPCGRCPACRKLEANAHPDLHLLAAEGASIPIDAVRSLQEALAFRAFERGRKVAIIRDAYRMTREASNALLKTVEEPPADTHVFLLAHQRNQLLPTLVSRCQAVRFEPLPEEEVARLLELRGLAAARAAEVARLSGGCPGTVLEADVDALESLDAEVRELWEGLPQLGVGERFALSEKWSKEKDRVEPRLERLEQHLRGLARAAAAAGGGDDRALWGLEGISTVRGLLERNVSTQLALDALLSGLFENWEELP